MREVAPGDLILSYADGRIRAFGIARSHAYEAPKPDEFGSAGRNWEQIGWRVDARFQEFAHEMRPAEWMSRLAPLLPERYAPLLPDGRGLQNLYLTELPTPLALELADLVGQGLPALARASAPADFDRSVVLADVTSGNSPAAEAATITEHALWEEHLRRRVEEDAELPATDREAIVLARRGQGLFPSRVQAFEARCRITGVDRAEHLRASHLKPWRDATNSERLAGENGLLLTPSIDHLLDRGFISFRGDGRLLVSPVADRQSLAKMGIAVDRDFDAGRFTTTQQQFLEFHRDEVFLQARRRVG